MCLDYLFTYTILLSTSADDVASPKGCLRMKKAHPCNLELCGNFPMFKSLVFHSRCSHWKSSLKLLLVNQMLCWVFCKKAANWKELNKRLKQITFKLNAHIIHSRLMAKNEKVIAACRMLFSLILLYLSTLLNSINLSCVGMYSVANQSVACYGLKCEKSSNGANPPLMTHFTRVDI